MACMLCSSEEDPTDEDVIPKCLLRAFDVRSGSTAVSIGEEYAEKHAIRNLKRFQVTLDDGLCRKCNNELLSSTMAQDPAYTPTATCSC